MSEEEIVKELLDNGGILIGSRAFDVAHENSDYDITILLENTPKRFKQVLESGGDYNIERYFNLLPKGKAWRLKYSSDIDIIVMEQQKDIDIVKEVIHDLKLLPKKYLEYRYIRTSLFEAGLKIKGWKEQL